MQNTNKTLIVISFVSGLFTAPAYAANIGSSSLAGAEPHHNASSVMTGFEGGKYDTSMTDTSVITPTEGNPSEIYDEQSLGDFDYVLEELSENEELFIRTGSPFDAADYEYLPQNDYAIYPEGMDVGPMTPIASAGFRVKF